MTSIDPHTARIVLALSYLVLAGAALVAARCLTRMALLLVSSRVLRWEHAHRNSSAHHHESVERLNGVIHRASRGIAMDVGWMLVLGAVLIAARRLLE